MKVVVKEFSKTFVCTVVIGVCSPNIKKTKMQMLLKVAHDCSLKNLSSTALMCCIGGMSPVQGEPSDSVWSSDGGATQDPERLHPDHEAGAGMFLLLLSLYSNTLLETW